MLEVTFTEALIVAQRRQVGTQMQAMIEDLDVQILNVTPATARRIGAIHAGWGKGIHPARLNLGDWFAHAAARELGCPLLIVGDNFGQADVRSALSAEP